MVDSDTISIDDIRNKIRKIKLIGKFLIVFGNRKLIFKEPNSSSHLTLQLLDEGILDIHETIESKVKTHVPIAKFDLRKFANRYHEIAEKYPIKCQEIDLNEPVLKDLCARVYAKLDELPSEIKGKELRFKEDRLLDLKLIPMKDLKEIDFRFAQIIKEGKEYGTLYNLDSRYILVKKSDFEGWVDRLSNALSQT